MQNKVDNYCSVLGLTGRITAEKVKLAYRKAILEWHPDRHHGRPTAEIAHTRAVAINEAYEFLSELTEEQELSSPTSSRTTVHNTYQTRHTYRRQSFTPGFPDPSVFEVFVKSSNIVSTAYNDATRALYLKFHNGATYRYHDVPRWVFDELLAAASHGRYANKNICHSFRYERC